MDPSLIAFLLAAAIRITGLPALAPEELPVFMALPGNEIQHQVCPEDPSNCRGVAAYFDSLRYRILYRDSLDLEDPVDHSFLLHEMVHVLQHRQMGNAMYADCHAMLHTEAQAYRAQNAYLRLQGQFMRVGNVLAFTTCAQEASYTPEARLAPGRIGP